MDNVWKTTTKQFIRSKSGIAGLVLISAILILVLYSSLAVPTDIALRWNNPQSWSQNPTNAAPSWVNILGGSVSPSISVNLNGWRSNNLSAGAGELYEYNVASNFSWTNSALPQDVLFVPNYQGRAVSAAVSWIKPGEKPISIQISQIQSGIQYDATTSDFKNAITQFILSQSGQYYSSLTKSQVISALFDSNGKNILSSTVSKGKYEVQIQLIATTPLGFASSSSLDVIGTSYGSMGTDYYGRPIDLGLLAGLPNALELGILTSVVAVVVGIVAGGISGYLGGKKDNLIQWTTLVFLALPALNFLVVLSYTTTLSLVEEGLLISFLIWPTYAIIARTVALSIKSQTYIEADRAMGVPAYRSFFSHFMPRLIPVSITYTVLGIPAAILLAETLGFLGIQPPNLVTWGAILDSAFVNEAALYGWWWWVVFPGLMIIVTALPFVLMGFSLEKIIAPRVNSK